MKLDSTWYDAVYYASCELTPIMKVPYSSFHAERKDLVMIISGFDIGIIFVFIFSLMAL